MNSKQIVREIMKQKGYSYLLLAKKLGYITDEEKEKEKVNRVTERLRGKTEMRVDTLVKFLSQMDCELIIKSTTKDNLEWKVTLTDESSNEEEK